MQHAKHAQSFASVRDRRAPRLNAIEELLALVAKRFPSLKWNRDGAPFNGGGNAVLPLHPVGIEDELLGGSVVEHCHLFRTHHDETLLLERMKPAHEDVSAHAVGKLELAQGYVGDARVEVASALAGDRQGRLAEKAEDDADVVRRKAPENVFLGADFADVEAIRIDVVDSSQGAIADELLQLDDGGMILEDVAHHQYSAVIRSYINQLRALGNVQREGFLDKDVLAREKRPLRHHIVMNGRGGKHDAVDVLVAKDAVVIAAEVCFRKLGAGSFQIRRIAVAYSVQRSQLMKIPGEVFSPVAMTDDCNVDLHRFLPYNGCALIHRREPAKPFLHIQDELTV